MTRAAGLIFIVLGVLVAIPQVFVLTPYQPVIALGVAFMVAGGLVLADYQPAAADDGGDHDDR